MSRFCGKCDFCDHLWIHCKTEEEINKLLDKSTIRIYGKDNREHVLDVHSIKDAIKYYPYLISIGSFSNEGHFVTLQSSSYIDIEEREHLQFCIDNVLKYWRKCKREKIEFDENDCYNKVCYSYNEDKQLQEIIARVVKDGNKAKFDDIHKPMWERMRREWFDEMIKYGYSETEAFRWCFNEWWFTDDIVEKRLGRQLIYEEKN